MWWSRGNFQLVVRMKLVVFFLIVYVERDVVSAETGDTKIIDGETINIEAYPFVGSLRKNNEPFYKHICSLILVSNVAAITAGHCLVRDRCMSPLEELPLLRIQQYFGEWGIQTRQIKRILLHPKMVVNQSLWIYNQFDLGAVLLASAIDDTDESVNIVRTYGEEEHAMWARKRALETNRTECDVLGRGVMKDSSEYPSSYVHPTYSEKLMLLETGIIDEKTCCSFVKSESQTICLARISDGRGGIACHLMRARSSTEMGDDGSPLVCYERSKYYLLGIHIGQMVDRRCSLYKPMQKGCQYYRVPGVYVDYETIIHFLNKNAFTLQWQMSGQIGIAPPVAVLVAVIAGFIMFTE